MRVALGIALFIFLLSSPLHAKCSKEEVCAMMSKMNHFAILDKCPAAGSLLSECKKAASTTIEDLPPAKFVDNGDGTVTDTVNKLLWIKKGIIGKVNFKDANAAANLAEEAGRSGWRLPTLPELKTLLYTERVVNVSGKKAWINPMFDDGLGHYYWSTTTCAEVSEITDRYQKKICQQGENAAWLVHFNINAVFWFNTSLEKPNIWLVQNMK